MQNGQNLMSSFEFIAALMSIIVGLGVTNLLAGAGRAFYRRKENPLDEVHIVLTLATLLLLSLQWWVTFKWNTEVSWSFDKFLVLIVWTITLYMLTVFLYPPDLSRSGRTPGPIRTKPVGLLFCVYCDVLIRHRANRNPRGLISSNLVSAFYRAICRTRCHRPHCTPSRVRSFLCAVPIDHAAGLGSRRKANSHRSRVTPA